MRSVHSAETIKNVCDLYREGVTAEEIGKRFYLTRNQVCGIVGRANAFRSSGQLVGPPRSNACAYIDNAWINWRDHTRARLDWLYGYERARRIDYGVDLETQADVARWNMLGRRDAA